MAVLAVKLALIGAAKGCWMSPKSAFPFGPRPLGGAGGSHVDEAGVGAAGDRKIQQTKGVP